MTPSLPSSAQHPNSVLTGAQGGVLTLPVCDHYSGVEARMRKSLELQARWFNDHGLCPFDVTLDAEDGAPTGREAEHIELIVRLLREAAVPQVRVGARVHDVLHPSFQDDVKRLVGAVADRLAFLMVPKVDTPEQLQCAIQAIDAAGGSQVPLHILVESPLAIVHVTTLAAHPRVQSISFGLMDFISSYGGAIPESAMGVQGQFEHPIVVRAKLAIAEACHAYGKVPAHGVVTEFRNADALLQAATRAGRELGFTRMWSIHPDQIPVIVRALTPDAALVEHAAQVLLLAAAAHWAPIEFQQRLHDRASYRYYWQVLQRAHQTGAPVPADVQPWFF